jgi:hypothetical protein
MPEEERMRRYKEKYGASAGDQKASQPQSRSQKPKATGAQKPQNTRQQGAKQPAMPAAQKVPEKKGGLLEKIKKIFKRGE